jgi:phytoene desaturase
MYLGGSPYRLPGIFSILPYGELAHGLWLPRGGIYALIQAIERMATDLGVEILTQHRARRIRVGGSTVEGVDLEDGRFFDSPLVVSNVDAPSTHRQLLGRKPPSEHKPKMTPSVMTFYWGVRGKVTGASHHTIFLPNDARQNYRDLLERGRIPAELPFYMSIATETEPSLAPDGMSAVFILVPLPRISSLKSWDMAQLTAHLKERISERLHRHGIRLAPSDALVERTLSPADWEQQFSLHDGSAFGAAHTLFQMGPFRCPNRDPTVRGLYYVGASTTPGTGLPMVVLGGEMTVERALNDLL